MRSLTLRPLLFALALIALACGMRWPGLGKTIWNLDEGSTFTMAEIVRDGGVMYRDAADNRTPLVPYLKAAILTVVGDWNIRSAHIILAGMIGLTAVALWRLGRRGKDEPAGAMAAIYFSGLSFVMLGPVDAMAAHTGWFLIFFSALGMWSFVAALERMSGWLSFSAGSAFGLAALAKQPGLLDWGVCLVLCALTAWCRPGQRRELVRLTAFLAVGFAWPLVATYWYFNAQGAWADLVQYAWTYNTQLYVPEVPFRERLLGILTPLQLARENVLFAFLIGILAAGWLLIHTLPDLWKRPREFKVLPWLILGWSASGLVSTVLSGRTFAHYSIQVIPGLSLACGWVSVKLWKKSSEWNSSASKIGSWLTRSVIAVGLLSLCWSVIHRANSFDLTEGISKDIGLVIKARTKPEEKIFVWGYEPELHVFSQRLPNTRFVYSVFLTGLIPWTNLDALKNTDYAIVPGAWDAFWRDFMRSPPAVIVDTHGNRGFLKYPLRKQERLWAIVEKDYVEVAVDYARARGYTLYQRASTAPEANLGSLKENPLLRLTEVSRDAANNAKVRVDIAAGISALDLYLDGKPYRRIENPGQQAVQVSFSVLGTDLSVGQHKLQAVARSVVRDEASQVYPLNIELTHTIDRKYEGPPLFFAGQKFLPLESETISGNPVAFRQDIGQWDAHAPSRLVYNRPEGLSEIEFSFGMLPGAYDGSNPQKSDGVDVSVYFENEKGNRSEIYRRNVDPIARETDRKLMTGQAILPGLTGGKLLFNITPGRMNNPAFDWSYWSRLEGKPPFLSLNFRGKVISPIELEAALGVSLVDYGKRKVQLVHAPSHVTFRQPVGMAALSGELGLLDEAWRGPKQTSGAIFEIEHILPDGEHRILLTKVLYPGIKPEDRGIHSFKVNLDYIKDSLIRLSTRAADPGNNSFNYTFWHGLEFGQFSAHLNFEGREILSSESEAPNGFNYLEEEGGQVLFAHAPSEIVFPIAPEARRVEGKMGLIRGAYTDRGQTDGAVFVVEVETNSGTRHEIFRRYLNPRDIAADRGRVPFSVDLPESNECRLILRIEAAPSGRLNSAWSYWDGLKLVR